MSEPPGPIDEAALALLVGHYQGLVVRLASAADSDEREAVRDELRAALEELWPALEALVHPLAWTWVRRHLADLGGSRGVRDAHEGVRTSMCMHILDTIAAHPVAPTPPIAPLLKRIARNRMVDELRHSRRHSPDRPAPAGPPPTAGAADAQPPSPAYPASLDEAALYDHPVLSLDIAVQLDDRLYRDECLGAIRQYWELRLSADEWRIVRARLADPPTPYDSIAALFAPPWSPAAVRKRYSRIIADTRAHLRALDLLPALQLND